MKFNLKTQAEPWGLRANTYDADDETEILIRVLSFGPMLRVTSPERFIKLIRERLRRQKIFS